MPSSSHPTLGAALRDEECATIQLASGSFDENVSIERGVAITGAGSAATSIRGNITGSGQNVAVVLASLTIDNTGPGVAGCWLDAMVAEEGAEISGGPDLVVLQTTKSGGECRIFADGFESSSVLAWSAHVL